MTNIFIANLDWEITSEDLQATFSAFGAVHLAHVVFDAKTKQSKGFGYVEMESAEEAINGTANMFKVAPAMVANSPFALMGPPDSSMHHWHRAAYCNH